LKAAGRKPRGLFYVFGQVSRELDEKMNLESQDLATSGASIVKTVVAGFYFYYYYYYYRGGPP
jgi:hypothetical protein